MTIEFTEAQQRKIVSLLARIDRQHADLKTQNMTRMIRVEVYKFERRAKRSIIRTTTNQL